MCEIPALAGDPYEQMEREPMTYGLLAALAWGISTLLAAVAARRIGALRTVVIGEAAGLCCYGPLFLLGHFSLRGVGGVAWLLVLAGVIGVAGYLAMYRGLESGHIDLVSAISARYGGVIAVLSWWCCTSGSPSRRSAASSPPWPGS
jgi:uncharacterized membrane protein